MTWQASTEHTWPDLAHQVRVDQDGGPQTYSVASSISISEDMDCKEDNFYFFIKHGDMNAFQDS